MDNNMASHRGAFSFLITKVPEKNCFLISWLFTQMYPVALHRRAQHSPASWGHSWCILLDLGMASWQISSVLNICRASHREGAAVTPQPPQLTLGHQITAPHWQGPCSFSQASSGARDYSHLFMGQKDRIKILGKFRCCPISSFLITQCQCTCIHTIRAGRQ